MQDRFVAELLIGTHYSVYWNSLWCEQVPVVWQLKKHGISETSRRFSWC